MGQCHPAYISGKPNETEANTSRDLDGCATFGKRTSGGGNIISLDEATLTAYGALRKAALS
jgi:hypothetical protein